MTVYKWMMAQEHIAVWVFKRRLISFLFTPVSSLLWKQILKRNHFVWFYFTFWMLVQSFLTQNPLWFSSIMSTIWNHSSDLVLHFYKVGVLTKDRMVRLDWVIFSCLCAALKTLNPTFPIMQFSIVFYEITRAFLSLWKAHSQLQRMLYSFHRLRSTPHDKK